MIDEKFLFYWDYFLSLEKDLFKISEYIQFNEENYQTFSIKNAQLILLAGGELDGVLKNLCKQIAPKEARGNIGDYKKSILSFYGENFSLKEAYIPRYDLSIQPWQKWNEEKDTKLKWWDDYSNIKHSRRKNYRKATLSNTINCLAAIQIALFFYNEAIRNNKSKDGEMHYWEPMNVNGELVDPYSKNMNEDTLLFKLKY